MLYRPIALILYELLIFFKLVAIGFPLGIASATDRKAPTAGVNTGIFF
jgi:hypothetical protein